MDRIYGNYQTAGVEVVTTGKGQINSQGTNAYAQAVVLVDANGVVIANPTGTNISTNTTTTVKTGPGVFVGITVNTAGVTSAAVVYDNTAGSGTKLGTFATTAQGFTASGAGFATGLTVVTTGGTPADITIVYR